MNDARLAKFAEVASRISYFSFCFCNNTMIQRLICSRSVNVSLHIFNFKLKLIFSLSTIVERIEKMLAVFAILGKKRKNDNKLRTLNFQGLELARASVRASYLRRIPLNVRAISAKNIYQKTTHSTVTF